MNRTAIKEILEKVTESISACTDVHIVAAFKILVNLVEMLAEENSALKEENQRLKDEINRLKGEQGKPDFKKQQNDNPENTNHSSEADRKKRNKDKKDRKAKNKKHKIKIDRTVKIEIDNQNSLPEDLSLKVITPLLFKTSLSKQIMSNSWGQSIIQGRWIKPL